MKASLEIGDFKSIKVQERLILCRPSCHLRDGAIWYDWWM